MTLTTTTGKTYVIIDENSPIIRLDCTGGCVEDLFSLKQFLGNIKKRTTVKLITTTGKVKRGKMFGKPLILKQKSTPNANRLQKISS